MAELSPKLRLNCWRKPYASKFNGWILFSHQRDTLILPRKTCLFLRNVFTNEVILLPELDLDCKAATFTADPTSPECSVLVLGYHRSSSRCCFGKDCCYNSTGLHFASYCLPKVKTWTRDSVHTRSMGYPRPGVGIWEVERPVVRGWEAPSPAFCSLVYMDERLYCLGYGGRLISFNFLGGRPKYLTEPEHGPYEGGNSSSGCWLFEDDEKSLVMIDRSVTNQWSIWKLDRLQRRWVVKTDLGHTAYFINNKITFAAPLDDGVDGEELDDCRVYYDSDGSIECYSFLQGRCIQSNLYSWFGNLDDGKICFIQPPC